MFDWDFYQPLTCHYLDRGMQPKALKLCFKLMCLQSHSHGCDLQKVCCSNKTETTLQVANSPARQNVSSRHLGFGETSGKLAEMDWQVTAIRMSRCNPIDPIASWGMHIYALLQSQRGASRVSAPIHRGFSIWSSRKSLALQNYNCALTPPSRPSSGSWWYSHLLWMEDIRGLGKWNERRLLHFFRTTIANRSAIPRRVAASAACVLKHWLLPSKINQH